MAPAVLAEGPWARDGRRNRDGNECRTGAATGTARAAASALAFFSLRLYSTFSALRSRCDAWVALYDALGGAAWPVGALRSCASLRTDPCGCELSSWRYALRCTDKRVTCCCA